MIIINFHRISQVKPSVYDIRKIKFRDDILHPGVMEWQGFGRESYEKLELSF